jgi:hypothetical protein
MAVRIYGRGWNVWPGAAGTLLDYGGFCNEMRSAFFIIIIY